MPTARSNSKCPYCDHLSPAGSKFCNDCGAALHLRPCPHCGSVNDVTLNTRCSRCNGDLGFAEPANPAAASLAAEAVTTTPSAALSEPALSEPAISSATPFARQATTPRAPLIGIALLALAGAAYFGLTPRPESGQSSAPAEAARPDSAVVEKLAVMTPAVSPAAPVLATPASVASTSGPAQPPQEAVAAPAFAASLARLSPPGAGRSAHRREAAIAPAGAAASPVAERFNTRTRKPGEGLDLKQPNIGSCTDAVAALGLCAAESNPRRP